VSQAALRATQLVRRYGEKDAVQGVSLTIERAESVALRGPSGCGKTTLLHMLGLLLRPTRGGVFLEGSDAWEMPASERARLRLERIGFVFQQQNLLTHLTARENIALPAWRLTGSRKTALTQADKLLERLGLSAFAAQPPQILSTGEAHLIAIARALVNRPTVVLADEPTGNLDSESAEQVLQLLDEICAMGAALFVVTHDRSVAERAARQIVMRDGLFLPDRT
jgi:putative ABC transport system ATP-binding protein